MFPVRRDEPQAQSNSVEFKFASRTESQMVSGSGPLFRTLAGRRKSSA
jgi:hypothetical protein